MNQLSLEDEVQIRIFAQQVQTMSEAEVKENLKRYFEIWIRREAMYKHFLAQEWGLEPPTKPTDLTQDDSLNEWG